MEVIPAPQKPSQKVLIILLLHSWIKHLNGLFQPNVVYIIFYTDAEGQLPRCHKSHLGLIMCSW